MSRGLLRGELYRLCGVDLTQAPGLQINTALVLFTELGAARQTGGRTEKGKRKGEEGRSAETSLGLPREAKPFTRFNNA